jgi:glycosyltransferase involved in cell wall biosynthesis
MGTHRPLVSVIIPVHNGERYLGEAIESVRRQTYWPFEIIAVDDGSTDGSAALVRSYPEIRLIQQPNAGNAAARNTGLAAAAGELLAFLDQDDFWSDQKLAVQVGHMLRQPALAYTLAQRLLFLDPGFERPPWLKPEPFVTPETGAVPGTLVARRRAFDRIGRFDPDLRLANDVDWLARARDAELPMAVLPDLLLYSRVHAGNLSADFRTGFSETLLLLRASIARKRAAPAAPGATPLGEG